MSIKVEFEVKERRFGFRDWDLSWKFYEHECGKAREYVRKFDKDHEWEAILIKRTIIEEVL